jgi:hypothetical protein
MATLFRPQKGDTSRLPETAWLLGVDQIRKRRGSNCIRADSYREFERCIVFAITDFLIRGPEPVRLEATERIGEAFSENAVFEQKFQIDKVCLREIPKSLEVQSLSDIGDISRLILRECMWARLRSGKRLVHFGWDSYVYFSGAVVAKTMQEQFQLIGRAIETRTLPKIHR